MGVLSRFGLRASMALALLLLIVPPASAVPASQAMPPVGEPVGANWMVYGGNLYNQRYSSLNQINSGNVANLKGAWTYQVDGNSAATSFESSPIVIDGMMFLTGPQSQVYAVDARTGQEIWRYVPVLSDIAALPLCCGQVNRGVAVGQNKVYVAQLDARLVALD